MRYSELTLEGRNAVIEAFRAGKTIDKLFVLEHCQEGSMNTIIREAKKKDTIINYVKKERLDQMSETFLIFGNSFNNALVVCSATASIKSNLFSVKNLFINLHAFA